MPVSLKITLVAAVMSLGLCAVAAAHHSGAAYDMEHQRTVAGIVKTVNWTNPHITFVIETDAADGQPAATLVFEVSSPGVLTRSGWTKRSLQPGDHAVFRYAPLRAGGAGGFLVRVTLPDGKELSFSLTPPDQADQ
jgi:Cu/Ag efflux protein CusF